ncbi:MAG: aa3-type cytochrome c oxidase subunit IV [Pikeienuella sp.]
MAEHRQGEMDISEQKRTFAGFIKSGVWLAVSIVVILIILAIVGI